MSLKFNIGDGPSLFDLMTSLFDGKIVYFTKAGQGHPLISEKIVIKGIIKSVEEVGDEYDSWEIKIKILEDDSLTFLCGKTYPGFYCSRTRRGQINIINFPK